MPSYRGWVLLAILALAFSPLPLAAQSTEGEGVVQGNYNIKQSFEIGYRHTDFTGSRQVYQTFVNFGSGPRLLEHTLEMRSIDHQGWLFDDFFVSSFGYGGDPNSFTRLRAYKNRWYNFSGSFRLDRNTWNYNLLANPLNPTTSNPFFPITESLHRFETVRRLSDYNLTLLPQSSVRFRLGYSRNVHVGPSFTSFHEGTDVLLFQDWKNTLNSYTFGVDFRKIPRTNISFDQFFHNFKGDTTWEDTVGQTQLGFPRFFAMLSNGVPVDLGAIFNTASNQPCGTPVTNFTTSPPTANATCNGYIAYNRVGNIRTDYPTSQLSFQTNYWTQLDLSGRFSYSGGDSDILGFNEFYQGLVTRTRQRQFALNGPASAKRVAVTADFAVTWHITDKLRVIDSFRFHHFRLPGFFDLTELSLFGTSMIVAPNIFTPGATPPTNCPTITSPGCPQHTNSSPADVISEQFSLFLGQDSKFNQIEFGYDLNRHFGGRIGYRYRGRDITHSEVETGDLWYFPTLPNRGACAGQPLLPDGSCRVLTEDGFLEETEINEHSFLLSLWGRPNANFRAAFDMEILSADNVFTRISPRNLQRYKFRTTWKPASWANISGTLNLMESRNNVPEVEHKQHNRNFGFGATLMPNARFSLDFGYNYQDIFSATNICFVGSLQPPGTSPCPTASALLQQISMYDDNVHYFYFDTMWKPLQRLTAHLGYTVTSTSGDTLILSPDAPVGSLAYNYHQPRAGLEYDFGRGFTGRAFWNHYGYNEKALPDPTTAPRDFRGNMFTMSVRYGF